VRGPRFHQARPLRRFRTDRLTFGIPWVERVFSRTAAMLNLFSRNTTVIMTKWEGQSPYTQFETKRKRPFSMWFSRQALSRLVNPASAADAHQGQRWGLL
jgi:hypothetical protein